jgi:hypothetical protein
VLAPHVALPRPRWRPPKFFLCPARVARVSKASGRYFRMFRTPRPLLLLDLESRSEAQNRLVLLALPFWAVNRARNDRRIIDSLVLFFGNSLPHPRSWVVIHGFNAKQAESYTRCDCPHSQDSPANTLEDLRSAHAQHNPGAARPLPHPPPPQVSLPAANNLWCARNPPLA